MWLYFDECTDIDEEEWARIDALLKRRQESNCVFTSALDVDIGGGDHRKGLRFVALGALLPTSSGSTTTN